MAREMALDRQQSAFHQIMVQLAPRPTDVLCVGAAFLGCSARKGNRYTPMLKAMLRYFCRFRRVVFLVSGGGGCTGFPEGEGRVHMEEGGACLLVCTRMFACLCLPIPARAVLVCGCTSMAWWVCVCGMEGVCGVVQPRT